VLIDPWIRPFRGPGAKWQSGLYLVVQTHRVTVLKVVEKDDRTLRPPIQRQCGVEGPSTGSRREGSSWWTGLVHKESG
jgi:hypothetical protein